MYILPHELKSEICSWLNFDSIGRITCVNKEFSSICTQWSFWTSIFDVCKLGIVNFNNPKTFTTVKKDLIRAESHVDVLNGSQPQAKMIRVSPGHWLRTQALHKLLHIDGHNKLESFIKAIEKYHTVPLITIGRFSHRRYICDLYYDLSGHINSECQRVQVCLGSRETFGLVFRLIHIGETRLKIYQNRVDVDPTF